VGCQEEMVLDPWGKAPLPDAEAAEAEGERGPAEPAADAWAGSPWAREAGACAQAAATPSPIRLGLPVLRWDVPDAGSQ
jgi:hypothetical protein